MKKKSISLSGHRTSILLEADFWHELDVFAEMDGLSLAALVGQIDEARIQENTDAPANLASAIRLYILRRLKSTYQ